MYEKYSSYKDSGVDWLGLVPEHWEVTRLGTLLKPISIRNRADLPLLSITREDGVIVRDIEDDTTNHNFIPDDLSNYKVLRKGQFGMNKMKAWQGSYGISPETGIVSPAYYIFDFNKQIDSRFFHFAIRSKNYVSFFGQASDGVRIGQWDLSQTRMKEIPFFIPPLSEQTAIANYLDQKTTQIDRAIELKEQTIALLKERKQIVIQELVTGKWRIDNGELKMRNKSELKDSGVEWIGEVPKEWEVKRLKTLGYIYSGLSGKSGSDFNVEDIESVKPFIPFTNIYRNLKIDTTQYQYVKIGNFEIQNRVIKNDLLFLMSSETLEDIGKSAIYLGNDAELYLNSFCRGFRITSNQAYPNYINYLLSSQCYRDYFSVVARGFTRINLKQEYVNNAFILLPDMATQHEIAGFLDQYDIDINKAISLQEQEIEKLKELKATLIDGAVTGKIRVIEN